MMRSSCAAGTRPSTRTLPPLPPLELSRYPPASWISNSTCRPATTGESTTTTCSPVRTVMRSTVEPAGAMGSGDARGRKPRLHARATPASTSAAPVRYIEERDMVGLEEGGSPWYSAERRRCQCGTSQKRPRLLGRGPSRPGRNRTCNPRFWSAVPATPALERLLIFKDLALSEQRRRRWTTLALALFLALRAGRRGSYVASVRS